MEETEVCTQCVANEHRCVSCRKTRHNHSNPFCPDCEGMSDWTWQVRYAKLAWSDETLTVSIPLEHRFKFGLVNALTGKRRNVFFDSFVIAVASAQQLNKNEAAERPDLF